MKPYELDYCSECESGISSSREGVDVDRSHFATSEYLMKFCETSRMLEIAGF